MGLEYGYSGQSLPINLSCRSVESRYFACIADSRTTLAAHSCEHLQVTSPACVPSTPVKTLQTSLKQYELRPSLVAMDLI